MDIKQMIDRYKIVSAQNGTLRIYNVSLAQRDGIVSEIKARKPEIIAYFAAEKAAKEKAAEDRQRKIGAIDGLEALQTAIADCAAWEREYADNIDSGKSGVGLRKKPDHDIDALKARYPRAAAYIKAFDMSLSSSAAKAAAYEKALERIINGDDHNAALSDAEAEWGAYVQEHLWD